MNRNIESSAELAAAITRAASKQTYYTIRFLVDRDLVPDAYRAYAYFRWVDDMLDQDGLPNSERIAFIERQRSLVHGCYLRQWPGKVSAEERMLVDLIRTDPSENTGLHAYIHNMMAVMLFDTQRLGRLISQKELDEYSLTLATAVTEALHYFIGHRCYAPRGETRYLSATAAHVVHMLRDTFEDNAVGYYNIPGEILEAHRLSPQDVGSSPYRFWVKRRVQLARGYIAAGKEYLGQLENFRCRIAGYIYIARFEGVLNTLEREGYRLRPAYPERKSLTSGLKIAWSTLLQIVSHHRDQWLSRYPARQIKSSVGEP
jgi:phytoene/squalene synthetase